MVLIGFLFAECTVHGEGEQHPVLTEQPLSIGSFKSELGYLTLKQAGSRCTIIQNIQKLPGGSTAHHQVEKCALSVSVSSR